MKVLVDSDLLLEFFVNRSEFVEPVEKLLEMVKSQQIEIYVTDLCLNNIDFYLGKPDPQLGKDTVSIIVRLVNNCIIPIEHNFIDQARKSTLSDFDSAVEIICANAMDIGAIITHKPSDFAGANLQVLSVNDLLQRQTVANIYSSLEQSTKNIKDSFNSFIRNKWDDFNNFNPKFLSAGNVIALENQLKQSFKLRLIISYYYFIFRVLWYQINMAKHNKAISTVIIREEFVTFHYASKSRVKTN